MDKTLTEQEIALLRRKLDLLLRTGQLLVESAADTNRVVRNLNRVAAYLGLPEEKLHIDVSYTMLVVNVATACIRSPNSRNAKSMAST